MTDTELTEIEANAKEEQPASWYVLELIKEIRQLRKEIRHLQAERDWIISRALNKADLCCSNKLCSCDEKSISDERCTRCWQLAAREATCQKS